MLVVVCSATGADGDDAWATGVATEAACCGADAAGNCLPVTTPACASSDAANARLNAMPEPVAGAVCAVEPVDFPRFPNSLAMSDPI